MQVSVIQRPWHNLSGFVNYTRAKELDDTGNHRTQYGVGPQDGNFTRNYAANEIDRALGTANQTNAFNLTWVYSFPFGRGQAFFATNRIMGLIGGGWQLSGIYRYRDGYPLQVTNGGGCMTNSDAGQGTCIPDYVPGFNKRQARINGRWGRGPGANAGNINQISYINSNAFECPDSSPQATTYTCGATTEPNTTFKLGNVARTAPYGPTGPGWWDIQMGLRRTFNVRETATLHLTFQVEADVDNATNSTFFNSVQLHLGQRSAFGARRRPEQEHPAARLAVRRPLPLLTGQRESTGRASLDRPASPKGMAAMHPAWPPFLCLKSAAVFSRREASHRAIPPALSG